MSSANKCLTSSVGKRPVMSNVLPIKSFDLVVRPLIVCNICFGPFIKVYRALFMPHALLPVAPSFPSPYAYLKFG
ncbi:hypothetical protein LguiA_009837 [Lonicera macranthoides]